MPKFFNKRGFTLVELLIVIAILAILAAVLVLIINPLELLRRSRDATRLTDLDNINRAIVVALEEATGSGVTCKYPGGGSGTCGALVGNLNPGRSNAGGRTSDGNGWVKVNLLNQVAISMPVLPVDPINDSTNHYTYCASWNTTSETWELDTTLESAQYSGKMTADGGNAAIRYEIGTDLTLISGATCGY